MRMKFKKITIKNFMSYQEAELSLDRHGYILVRGTNNNPLDNARSNGTGKSTLFSAISWALTGLTVGGGKEVANIYLEGTTSAELDFSVDNIEYKVIRTKNPSNLKFYVNDEDKSGKGIRDTEKILSEYLPDVTHSLLNSVIILGQGLPQKFTSNTPSGRKEVLEKLTNSDFMIQDLKTRVDSRISKLKSDKRNIENEITDAQARKDILNKQQEDLANKLENDYNENKLNDINCSIIELEDSLTSKTVLHIENEDRLKIYNQRLKEALDKQTKKTTKYTQDRAKVVLEDIRGLDSDINVISGDISALSAEIRKLESVKDVCPTCGQKLPNVTKIDTTSKHAELNDLNSQLLKFKEERQARIDYNNDVLSKFDSDFNSSVADLNNYINEEKQVITKFERANDSVNQDINSIKSQIQTLKFQRDSFNTDRENLIHQIENHKNEIQELADKIMYNNDVLEDLDNRLSVDNKMSTILKRDFRGYLLTNIIDFISSRAKNYSQELFNSDRLNFCLEGNNINITYDSKDYEVLSGGEKQKVDVIVQLSIRDMLCNFLNFSSNILVLDEITDSLDGEGSQKMFNLISTKLNDVEAIYIISHHTDELQIPCDDVITIIKGQDRISRIVY